MFFSLKKKNFLDLKAFRCLLLFPFRSPLEDILNIEEFEKCFCRTTLFCCLISIKFSDLDDETRRDNIELKDPSTAIKENRIITCRSTNRNNEAPGMVDRHIQEHSKNRRLRNVTMQGRNFNITLSNPQEPQQQFRNNSRNWRESARSLRGIYNLDLLITIIFQKYFFMFQICIEDVIFLQYIFKINNDLKDKCGSINNRTMSEMHATAQPPIAMIIHQIPLMIIIHIHDISMDQVQVGNK